MEFRDLKKQYQNNKHNIDSAIRKALERADFIGGKQVRELEEKLAEYVGVKYCISCANGTDALQLALMAWGIGPGDVVFVPDFTFFSSGEVVPLTGATPVFVDVREDTYNLDCSSLENAIQYVLGHTELRPRAVVAVDLFGQPAEYDRIRRIADQYGLYVLEDAAQGFGGTIHGKRACSFGDISTTSFFPAKPLGCYGDGGAIFTDNDEWDSLLRSYRVHGKGKDKYDNVRIGLNSRLDTIQAAVLLEKLKLFDEELGLCHEAAEEYTRQLKGYVRTPVILPGMTSSWAQYTICLRDNRQRERLSVNLQKSGIPTAVYYKKPMHLQAAFLPYTITGQDFAATERICHVCLSLPMHAYLEADVLKSVCEEIIRNIEEEK